MAETTATIVATSDLHGLLDGIEQVCRDKQADYLVIAGDIEPADLFTSKPYWYEHTFFPMIGRLDCEVVAIPGNHDFWLSAKYLAIKNGAVKFIPDNFHFLVDEGIELKGIRFYGTPWVPFISGSWCFESEDADLADRFNMIPSGIDILITHTPPLVPHKKIDVSCEFSNERQRHFGSKSLTDALINKKPKHCFCGHIHSGDHKPLLIGECTVYNVSRVDEKYNIAFPLETIGTTF